MRTDFKLRLDTASDFDELFDIYMDEKINPKFQRQGIGTKFMRALINKVRADGIKRIDLCAEADNPVALNFYKKLGFQLEGILKKYFKRPNENQYIDEHMLVLFPDDETVS